MNRDSLFDDLRLNRLFLEVDKSLLCELSKDCFIERSFYKGETIIRQDEVSADLFLILNGRVQISKILPDGERVELIQKGPNEFIGEIGLLLTSSRSATVTCLTDVRIVQITPASFSQILKKIPTIRKNVLKNIIEIVFDDDQRVVNEIIKGNLLAEMFNAISDQTKRLESLNRQLKDVNSELEKKNKKLYELATYDYLTKLYNRAFVMDMFSKEFSKSKRHGHELACLLLDIDNFKKINDTYGHLTGDVVLRQIGLRLKADIREQDIVGRYGGEEFLIVLPNTNLEQALFVAEKVRKKIEDLEIRSNNKMIKTSVSIGVSDINHNGPDKVDDLLYQADTALYRAKRKGKNRTVPFQPEPNA